MQRSEISPGPPWVIVAGGFHRHGGMDAANAALASYLAERGTPVHLVGHLFDEQLLKNPALTAYRVARPLGSDLLGHRSLERRGWAVANRILRSNSETRVVVNGGNCNFSDINWAHAVHRAWAVSDEGAPVSFRIKHRLEKYLNRQRERRAFTSARVILANSNRTRDEIIRLGVPPNRVHTVYLGAEPRWRAIDDRVRAAARDSFRIALDRPAIAFIGALGHDRNKGFDTLWQAWQKLSAIVNWDVDLLVAGGGRALDSWRQRVSDAGLGQRVHLLGHIATVSQVLAAADLLVSPVRYEAYGLNVHEALCCGVPAIVTATAGIAERFPATLQDWLIPNPNDVEDLVRRLLLWRTSRASWKEHVRPLMHELRARSWEQMAAEIVAIVSDAPSSKVACA